MDGVIQVVALALVCAIISILIAKQSPEMSVMLSIAVCAMIICAAFAGMRSLLEMISRLQQLSGIGTEHLQILLKSVGVGLITQITAMVCTDTGNSAIAKSVELFGSMVILSLSIPLLEDILELIATLAGGI